MASPGPIEQPLPSAEHELSPEESDALLSPPEAEPEPQPGLHGNPVQCEWQGSTRHE